ncbi:MAG TPA: alpha/beta fold hydrolase [Candidatus Binatia bacterium]|nr:alpha/beta fold hydrolase [Candidatus Binatia bacterium]
MPHASVNGVQLFYEELGAGTPILGIHGAGSSAVFWEEAAERLSGLGRVIIYDRRGSNRSDRPDPYETTSVQEHADDALALMRSLDAAPAILVGRSYGGTIALDLALRQPDAVLGIALLEAGPMGLSSEYDKWFVSVRAAAEDVEPDAVGETVLRAVFGAWEELPEIWRDVFTRNGPALLAELRGEERTDNNRLGELSVPSLVVTANDSLEPIRLGSEALARALPSARHARVGGDHAIDPAGTEVTDFVSALIGR